ncbi:MAG: HD domain-containing protein [Alphaproteobacteria bacterium]|nr:HD domain-containing protein [Alphaproteobacteria bacterium]
MLKNAHILLKNEYQKCFEKVKEDGYYACFAEEKLHHSLQVLGAGNFIIRHESWFANKTQDFIDLCKTAVLLHDIARFEEITVRYLRNVKIDHGEEGAKKLKLMPEFNDIRITLPIKHHGHVKEDFYRDAEFLNIKDTKLADEVEHIFFLIRDADKIANFNIVCNEREKFLPVFIPQKDEVSDQRSIITPEVKDDFLRCKTVNYALRRTQADHCLAFISWFFDINYQSSVVFCERLDLINKMFDGLKFYQNDENLAQDLKNLVIKYLTNIKS